MVICSDVSHKRMCIPSCSAVRVDNRSDIVIGAGRLTRWRSSSIGLFPVSMQSLTRVSQHKLPRVLTSGGSGVLLNSFTLADESIVGRGEAALDGGADSRVGEARAGAGDEALGKHGDGVGVRMGGC